MSWCGSRCAMPTIEEVLAKATARHEHMSRVAQTQAKDVVRMVAKRPAGPRRRLPVVAGVWRRLKLFANRGTTWLSM